MAKKESLIKTKDEILDILEGVFKNNPTIKVLVVTADGSCFQKRNNALNHMRSLPEDRLYVAKKVDSEIVFVEEPKVSVEGKKDETKTQDQEIDIDSADLTEDQLVLRMVKDLTVDELKAFAQSINVKKSALKNLNEEDMSRKILSFCTEPEKELLKETIKDKVGQGTEE